MARLPAMARLPVGKLAILAIWQLGKLANFQVGMMILDILNRFAHSAGPCLVVVYIVCPFFVSYVSTL